jgi:hypothetical protein
MFASVTNVSEDVQSCTGLMSRKGEIDVNQVERGLLAAKRLWMSG